MFLKWWINSVVCNTYPKKISGIEPKIIKLNNYRIKKQKITNLDYEKKIKWTDEKDKKLKMLYKKNLPEIALAKIFKTSTAEIRNRIKLYL